MQTETHLRTETLIPLSMIFHYLQHLEIDSPIIFPRQKFRPLHGKSIYIFSERIFYEKSSYQKDDTMFLKGILSVGIDPIPSWSFDIILPTHRMLLRSNHKGKVRETLTSCYQSQNF